jgi:hypothetical protein
VASKDNHQTVAERLLDAVDLITLFVAGVAATVVGIWAGEWWISFGSLVVPVLAVSLFRIRTRLDGVAQTVQDALGQLEVLEELALDPSAVEKNAAARRGKWGKTGEFGSGR